MDKSKEKKITVKSLKIEKNSLIKLLGQDENLEWKQEGENLTISIQISEEVGPAFALKIKPKPIYKK